MVTDTEAVSSCHSEINERLQLDAPAPKQQRLHLPRSLIGFCAKRQQLPLKRQRESFPA